MAKRGKRTIYFGGFDGAVGDDGGRAAYAHSAPLLMTALLLNGQRPLLSQVQAFDNEHLLAAIGEGSTADGRALLRLVRGDDLRVRLFAGGLTEPSGELEYDTLGNAFCTALERGAGFRLSAWPELDADPHLRADLARFLRVVPDGWDRVDEVATGPLLVRLRALSQLDINLIESREPELATPRKGAPSAYQRIERGLQRLEARGAEESRAARLLLAGGRELAGEAAPEEPGPHQNRTAWRTLIGETAGSADLSSDVWADATSVVDIAYHRTIGDSLDAGSSRVPGTRRAGEAMAYDGEASAGTELVAWGEGLKAREALTWSDVEAVLKEVDQVRGPQRPKVVADVTAKRMVADRRANHWVTKIAFKLPEIGAAGVAAVAGGGAGLALGGGGAFLVSAPVVASVRAALVPLVHKSERYLEDRMTASILDRAAGGVG